MMVLRSEVPFSSRLRTSCMLRGESTLVRMVEPGSSTLSCVSSSGSRVGIWIALPAAMAPRDPHPTPSPSLRPRRPGSPAPHPPRPRPLRAPAGTGRARPARCAPWRRQPRCPRPGPGPESAPPLLNRPRRSPGAPGASRVRSHLKHRAGPVSLQSPGDRSAAGRCQAGTGNGCGL